MALIQCPECGKDVSDKALTCIYCGCPLSKSMDTFATTQTGAIAVDDGESSKIDSKEFIIENGVLTNYKGVCGDVVIPDGVTVIGGHAFSCCDKLTSITIPSSITSIGNSAFFYCKNLSGVTFEKGSKLVSIDDCAFYGCTSLTSITIPHSVTSIGVDAFSLCLFENQIPKSGSFGGIYGVTAVTKPSTIIPKTTATAVSQSATASTPKATTISTQKVTVSETRTGVADYFKRKNPQASSENDSQIGSRTNETEKIFLNISLFIGVFAIIMLLVGLPLGNYRKGSAVGTVGRWEVDTSNMYDGRWLVVAILTIVFVVISALVTCLRKNCHFNFAVDITTLGVASASCIPMIVGGIKNFYNNTESTATGGVGFISGSKVTGTFWYYLIVLALICYVIAIWKYYLNHTYPEKK